MSYTDFRNIRAELTPSTGAPGRGAMARILAEASDSNTLPRRWQEVEIATGEKCDPWKLLPDRIYTLAAAAAAGSIKINGRTVSGSQVLAAFERALYAP